MLAKIFTEFHHPINYCHQNFKAMKQFDRRNFYRQRGKRRRIINVYNALIVKESFARIKEFKGLIEGLQKFKEDLENKIYIQ